jgi:hypothetical protein
MEYNMKEIQLTQGQVAMVDDWWFDELNQYKWRATWCSFTKSYYAVRHSKMLFGKRTSIRMHAVIAGTQKGMHTDHINHNTLDNQSGNLRICTNSQNQMNQGKHTDKYKGVRVCRKKWQALIQLNGKQYYLGTYFTPEDAARAYDESAKQLYGEYANLNFP